MDVLSIRKKVSANARTMLEKIFDNERKSSVDAIHKELDFARLIDRDIVRELIIKVNESRYKRE